SSPIAQTLVHLGTLAAAGQDDGEEAIEQIWARFLTRDVTNAQGEELRYYGSWNMSGTDRDLLLTLRNGECNGQCNAWAGLLVSVFRAQGIDVPTSSILRVLPLNGSERFMVNDWAFPADAGPNSRYINVPRQGWPL